jgi:hypothetical protein
MTDYWLRLATALCMSGIACGCSALDNCPDGQDDIVIDRPEATDLDAMKFESSSGWKSFDAFPAKTRIKFKHGLGVVPFLYKGYLSFTEEATNGNGGGSFTEAAGDALEWECMDSDMIVIRNDTCESHFYVKIVALGASSGEVVHECK